MQCYHSYYINYVSIWYDTVAPSERPVYHEILNYILKPIIVQTRNYISSHISWNFLGISLAFLCHRPRFETQCQFSDGLCSLLTVYSIVCCWYAAPVFGWCFLGPSWGSHDMGGWASPMGQELYTVFASAQMLHWLLLAGKRRTSSPKGNAHFLSHASFDPWAFTVVRRWAFGKVQGCKMVQATVARQSRNYGISRRVSFCMHLADKDRSIFLGRCAALRDYYYSDFHWILLLKPQSTVNLCLVYRTSSAVRV